MAISGSTLYVADTNNNRVNEYDLSSGGAFVLSFGTVGTGPGQFNSPYMVAVGPTGQIAVTDFGNNRISLWSS
jgi:DNA-binding beta-propeller fold protein YncE